MYSESSEQYWGNRNKKSNNKLSRIVLSASVGGLLLCLAVLFGGSQENNDTTRRHLTVSDIVPKPQVSPELSQQCFTKFKSSNDCLAVCSTESTKVPRPTMYQACINGCGQGFTMGTNAGCKDDKSKTTSSRSFDACVKYQNMLPKPDLFSTCRKHFSAAADRALTQSNGFIQMELEDEWEREKKRWLDSSSKI